MKKRVSTLILLRGLPTRCYNFKTIKIMLNLTHRGSKYSTRDLKREAISEECRLQQVNPTSNKHKMFTNQLKSPGLVKVFKIPLLANLLTDFKITMLVRLLRAKHLSPLETVTQSNSSSKFKTKNLSSKQEIISFKRITRMGFSQRM